MADTSLERREHAEPQPTNPDDHSVVTAPTHLPVRYNPDAPSEEWGWHGSWRQFAPKGSALILWIGVITLLLFNTTEHVSHVEDYYYNGIALIFAIYLIARERNARRMRRRQRQRDDVQHH